MGEHRRHFPHCPYVNAVYQNEDSESAQARSGDMLCKVCLDSDIQCLFLPCRHVVYCERCSYLISKCAVCRTDIGVVVKVFLPEIGCAQGEILIHSSDTEQSTLKNGNSQEIKTCY